MMTRKERRAMYGTGRQQIVAGRAQIVAGLEDELGEMTGYGFVGAAPPPPPGHPMAPHPMMHPMHPGHPMHPHHPGRWDHHRGYHDRGYVHPWGASFGVEPIAATGPVAYDRTSRIRVIDEPPRHERQFPIGFLSPFGVPVPANSTQTITATPQVIFRSERLAVPNSIVLNFQLVDIKVGKDSQLAAPGNLPTECFSNISIGVRMQLDTAEPGITLTLVAQNTDANNAHAFSSVLYGTVVE
jgi:hypothetical protein